MPEMPYVWSKGPMLEALDARYSLTAPNERLAILAQLKAQATPTNPGGTLGGSFDDTFPNWPNYLANPFWTPSRLRWHLNRHWFGLTTNGSEQPTSNSYAKGTIGGGGVITHGGWWINWTGEGGGQISPPWAVFRLGLIRAIEVSLFRRVDDNVLDHAWPIEFFWACGESRFEAHVSWTNRGGAGRVIMVIYTPGYQPALAGFSAQYLSDDINGTGIRSVGGGDQYGTEGMLVVGHKTQKPGTVTIAKGGVKEAFMEREAYGLGPSPIASWDSGASQPGPRRP